jgi:predicted Zn-dependent protease
LKRISLATAAALALLLAGCGDQTPSGPPHITEQDRQFGAEQHPQLLGQFGGAYDGEKARYVARIGEKLARAAGLGGDCTFTLVNSDVVNAFAVPGCYIYVTRGLLAVVTSEAELASVLGHELGHIVREHAQRQERRSLWRALGVLAVGLTGSERLTQLAGKAAQFFTMRYSRQQEYEADDLGIAYIRKAGYDPYEAADMLAALDRQEDYLTVSRGRDGARGIPEWNLSHPLTKNRIARAREIARATGLADNALPEAVAPYLHEVDGLLFGDDPEQGFVIGQRFAHPLMRIAFDAPPGFSLTNSPEAIGLNGPDGLIGEFGGDPMPEEGLDAYAEALAKTVVGDAPGEVTHVERTQINGLDAVVVQLLIASDKGDMAVAIASYDGGNGQACHFIILSPPGSNASAAIMALFRSFRRLTPEQAATLRPRVVRVVTAGPGDTVDSMARRVADVAPRALFQLLNGLAPGQALKPGEQVKIVTFAPRAG